MTGRNVRIEGERLQFWEDNALVAEMSADWLKSPAFPIPAGRSISFEFVTSSTEQCPLDAHCYKPAGHAPPCEHWGGRGIPAPGQERCPACHHAAHYDLVCGVRKNPNAMACLCTAMDGVSKPGPWARFKGTKSARGWLNQFGGPTRLRPLDVVFFLLAGGFLGYGVRILLEHLGS